MLIGIIGRVIVEDELKNNRGEYGKKQLLAISKNLTNKFGKGFSQSNLYNMKIELDSLLRIIIYI